MRGHERPAYVEAYTILLMIVGLFFVLGAVLHQWMIGRTGEDAAWAFRLVRNLEIVIAAAALLVAGFRAFDSRLAPPATAALSIFFALCFPFGTAVFLYWFLSVRKREAPPR